MEKYLSLLEKNPLFEEFNKAEIPNILSCIGATVSHYKKKDNIFFAGDNISHIGIVLSGMIKLQKEDINGNNVLVDKLKAGDIFGEALVCAGIKKIHLSVWAETDTEILLLGYNKILNICPSACSFHTKLIQNMLKSLALKLVGLNQKLEVTQKRSIREKLLAYFEICIRKSGKREFNIQLNRNELADYLGVNRSALSRELGNMKSEGVIDFNENRFTLIKS